MKNIPNYIREQTGNSGVKIGLGIAGVLVLAIVLFLTFRKGPVTEPLPIKEISDTGEETIIKKPTEQFSQPSEDEAYFEFDLDNALFSLILPKDTVINEPAESADLPEFFFSADLGDYVILTGQINSNPPNVGDDCSDFTQARLSNYDYTGEGFYRLNHQSGTPACVYSGRVSGNPVFEFDLVRNGRSFELQTMAPPGYGDPFVPHGQLVIVDEVTGETTTYTLSDGFESGDTSSWSVVTPQ